MQALEGLLVTFVVALGFVLTLVGKSIRIVKEYERGVVFRLGRVDPDNVKGPGLRVLVPFIVVVSGSFLLFAGIAARALRAPAQSGMETMRGVQGTARSRIGPDGGMVFVDGARWQATSDEVIESGQEIVVEEVTSNPTRLKVKPTAKGAS